MYVVNKNNRSSYYLVLCCSMLPAVYSDLKLCLLQLYSEAGDLYEKAQNWDKAAAVYIKIKSWSVDKSLLNMHWEQYVLS